MDTIKIATIFNETGTAMFDERPVSERIRLMNFANAVEAATMADIKKAAEALDGCFLEGSAQTILQELDKMKSTHQAFVAWRDKHKVSRTGPLVGWQIAELAKTLCDIAGWLPEAEAITDEEAPPTVDLGNDPDAGHGGYNWAAIR